MARRRREVGVLALVASITNADTGVRIPAVDLTISGEQTLAPDESALLVRCSPSPVNGARSGLGPRLIRTIAGASNGKTAHSRLE